MPAPAINQSISGAHNIVTGTGDVRIVYELPAVESDDYRALLLLLERVREFWIFGVLDNSTQGAALLQVASSSVGDATSHQWVQVTELSSRTRSIISDKPIEVAFDHAGRALLILGAEGSGKTTALLQLARSLIARAEKDPTQPIPIVFNLASWTGADTLLWWLVQELGSKYYVPIRLARSWLERQRLVILLDGLDEVNDFHREHCIAAINCFLREVGSPGVAVCSRFEEYWLQPARLAFGAAIRLEPLTPEQVDTYLSTGGTRLDALRATLAIDGDLCELACSPLLLGVMSLCLSRRACSAAPERRKSGRDLLAHLRNLSRTDVRASRR